MSELRDRNMISKATMIGRLVKIDYHVENSRAPRARAILLTSKRISGTDEEPVIKKSYHPVYFYGRMISVLEKHATPGCIVYLEGEIENFFYEENGGRWVYSITAGLLRVLDKIIDDHVTEDEADNIGNRLNPDSTTQVPVMYRQRRT